MGLITTNSLRQTFNRRVVQAALDKGTHLLMAIADHPWGKNTNDAAVRISMTVLAPGAGEGSVLTVTDEQPNEDGEILVELAEKTGLVHADLSIGANVAGAVALRAMAGISSPGVKLHGAGFLVTPADAASLGNSALLRDYRNGRDLTDKPRGVSIIDAFGLDAETLRAQHPAAYQWLLERVKPERDQNNRATYRDNWWIFGEPRRELRPALTGLPRYIATVETAKHRAFQFLDASILPDNMLIAIAVNDAFALGLLSSRLHAEWALVTGGTLEDRPRYNKTRCFETFPFPDEDTGLTPELRELIAQRAEQIDSHRKRVLSPEAGNAGLTLTGLYNVLTALREGRALTAKEKTIHTQGVVSVLRELHDELDAAVLSAYGLEATASTDDILSHLVQLNSQRAAEEAQGRVRWLRPEFQNPQNPLSKPELLAHEQQALEGDFGMQKPLSKAEQIKPAQQTAWPSTLPEQVSALAYVLSTSPMPLTLAALESHFKGRGAWKKSLPMLLQTLEALGRAQCVTVAGEAAWRG